MQTLNKYGAKANRVICEFDGLSTDSKPTASFTDPNTNATIYIDNGSVFNEMDTAKRYKYNKSSDTWEVQ